MIAKSTKHNPNYLAKIVVMPKYRDVKGLDKLGHVTIDGKDILTQKTFNTGEIFVYFPSGSALAPEFLSKNNDYSDQTLNVDPEKKGYFDKSGRVKAVKFKGAISDGYMVPISSLDVLVGDEYKRLENYVGQEFDTIGGVVLVKKYLKPIQKEPSVPGEKKTRDKNIKKHANRVIDTQFRFHYDTTHLDKNLHRLEADDLISITWKLHGTSFISGKVLCYREPKWYERLSAWLGRVFAGATDPQYTEYGNLYSSRSVIKNKYLNGNASGYYSDDVYGEANKLVDSQLLEGETVYGELVGFGKSGNAIQRGYDYGCVPGEMKLYVYRITYTSPKGHVVDLPYKLMSERCEQMGLTPVPLIFQGRLQDFVSNFEATIGPEQTWGNLLYKTLKENYIGGNSKFCKNKVPEEGVVVRREGIKAFALKFVSPEYKVRESKAKDDGEVDIEEEQEQLADVVE